MNAASKAIGIEDRIDRKTGAPALIGLALAMAIGSILQQISLGITSVANTAFDNALCAVGADLRPRAVRQEYRPDPLAGGWCFPCWVVADDRCIAERSCDR